MMKKGEGAAVVRLALLACGDKNAFFGQIKKCGKMIKNRTFFEKRIGEEYVIIKSAENFGCGG